MRLERGSRIEVWCEGKVPSGAWRPAEVITGNGHYYTVRIESFQVERVSRKMIRPSPPVLVTNDLEIGDVIEFYDNFCWKTGKIILKEAEGYFCVSLLGSSQEFRVKKTDIRVRQSWQNNRWIVLGKEADSRTEGPQFEDSALMNETEARSQNQRKGLRVTLNLRTGKIYMKDNHNENVQKPCESFTKSNKRSNSQLCKHDGRACKYRAIGPFESRAAGGADVAESVGSCSLNKNYNVCNVVQEQCSLDRSYGFSDGCSDAESSTEDDLTVEIHRLELKAYTSILRALYIAGPLNWKKEEIISDLRIYLNISNDEHLKELRRLMVKGPVVR